MNISWAAYAIIQAWQDLTDQPYLDLFDTRAKLIEFEYGGRKFKVNICLNEENELYIQNLGISGISG